MMQIDELIEFMNSGKKLIYENIKIFAKPKEQLKGN